MIVPLLKKLILRINSVQIFILLILFSNVGLSQLLHPADGILYDDTEVASLSISLAEEDWQAIKANPESNVEYPARLIFSHSESVDTIENIGFRVRGNSSRNAAKKSYKVSFNTFVPGRKYQGVEKLNLNGEHNDPSIIRSKVAWDFCETLAVPAARSNHVQLFVNELYLGLYLNTEHIDEEFIDHRFSNDRGNLFKCLWPADLHYKGPGSDIYKESFWGRKAYDLKTNTEKDDYTGLAKFIDILNNTPPDQFICEIESIFDVDNFLKALVMDVLTANWDGPINKNNFYLYEDFLTGKFSYIPYDLDNTFGIDFFNHDWAKENIYQWPSFFNEYRPLITEILSVPEYRNRYSFYLQKSIDSFFNISNLGPYLDEKLALIDDYRAIDTFANLDYGWSYDQFIESYTSPLGGHVPYALKNYITVRKNEALSQLNSQNILPILTHTDIDWSPEQINFTFHFLDDGQVNECEFHYQVNEQAWQSESLVINDQTSSFAFMATESGSLKYFVKLTDNSDESRSFPYCDFEQVYLNYQARPNLVINEYMADNTATIADEFGEYDDWVEIYNAGNQPYSLRFLYLSDDPDKPSKWQLPNESLNPGEYKIIWTDGQGYQGDHHANFKLSKSGEYLGLFDSKKNHFAIIDEVNFGPQTTDVSQARMPNGIGSFAADETATPEENNDIETKTKLPSINDIGLYPNPANDYVYLTLNNEVISDFRVYNTQGENMRAELKNGVINIQQWPSGLYYVQVITGNENICLSFIKH